MDRRTLGVETVEMGCENCSDESFIAALSAEDKLFRFFEE
jgi:hypothetical protein